MTTPRDICCGRRPRRIDIGKGTSLILTYCGSCDTTEWFRDGRRIDAPNIRAAASEIAREVKARRPGATVAGR